VAFVVREHCLAIHFDYCSLASVSGIEPNSLSIPFLRSHTNLFLEYFLQHKKTRVLPKIIDPSERCGSDGGFWCGLQNCNGCYIPLMNNGAVYLFREANVEIETCSFTPFPASIASSSSDMSQPTDVAHSRSCDCSLLHQSPQTIVDELECMYVLKLSISSSSISRGCRNRIAVLKGDKKYVL
jgi:hypothetical protein